MRSVFSCVMFININIIQENRIASIEIVLQYTLLPKCQLHFLKKQQQIASCLLKAYRIIQTIYCDNGIK